MRVALSQRKHGCLAIVDGIAARRFEREPVGGAARKFAALCSCRDERTSDQQGETGPLDVEQLAGLVNFAMRGQRVGEGCANRIIARRERQCRAVVGDGAVEITRPFAQLGAHGEQIGERRGL